ncbi:Nuclear/nucleolar GTPase 2 [Chlorella vulgaris]
MAKAKRDKAPKDTRKPKHSNDSNRANKESKAGFRDASTVRRLEMYKSKAKRDKKGRIISQDFQSSALPTTRIQPDRRWFGNTRVIGQKQLEAFREEMGAKVADPYAVIIREKKLPLSLLEDPEKKHAGKPARANLVQVQPFATTFGKAATRKRPKLGVDSYADLVQQASTTEVEFVDKSAAASLADEEARGVVRDAVFEKGQSKRIWGELYKVVDSSDVIIQVLDARDPNGTRCRHLEQHLKRNARHKHMLLLLNKCDLVPAWVTKRWLHTLSREFPTLAFHASITNPFGKGSLLSLLRQLARLRTDKQYISVGLVGYPNVGKSSVINTLRSKKVCKVAPVPGETKVWQYITLMKRIFLIDCPGVVYNKNQDSQTDTVLKGVVRVENLEDATEHVDQVLVRVKPEYLRRAYKLSEWSDTEDFLAQVARMSGKLGKGGEPDLNTAARMVLNDWQRGKIPFFTLPPGHTEDSPATLAAAEAAAAAASEVPVAAEGVTEEDAKAAIDGDPEKAAVAARAMATEAAVATAKQRRAAIPVQQGFFTAVDEGAAGGEEEEGGGDDDVISTSGSEEEGGSGEDSDEEEAQGGSEQPSGSGSDDEGADGSGSESESDGAGYDDQDLSWEAVMAAMQGGAAHSDDDDDEEEEKQAPAPPAPAAAATAAPASKKRKAAEAASPASQGGGRKQCKVAPPAAPAGRRKAAAGVAPAGGRKQQRGSGKAAAEAAVGEKRTRKQR